MENITATRDIYLAILPLQVLADDPKVEMFCQGLVMDLITDLSRFRSFRIMAYDSVKGIHPDEEPGSPAVEQMHLDYLVKGMARHQEGQLLLNLQLINVAQNRIAWAEKFSGGLSELFLIQENIVEKIAVSLQHFLDHDLLREIRKRPITSLSAYECWLRGYQELKKGTLGADEQAREYFRQAMDIDPHYPRAHTGMSLSFFNEWSCQLWSRWEVSQNGAFEWARKALELDEWDHVSNAILGRIFLFKAAYEKAEHYLRRSLQINPNDSETLILISVGFTYLGYLEEAKKLYERARRLNPANDSFALSCGAFVHFEMGDFDNAIALADRYEPGKGWVDFPAYQAAAFFRKGNMAKMQEYWQAYLQEFSLKINGGRPADPQTALQWTIDVNPYRHDTQIKPFWDYMRRNAAAVPATEPPAATPVFQNRFSREGDLWIMSYEEKQVHLPDLKGFHDLARLLAQPGRPIHCTDLMGAQTIEKAEAVFDEKAKAGYQKRIIALQEAMAEAGTAYQSERLAALQEEYDQLLEHLSRAIGKGGRTRQVAGTVEKCRTAVTWRIRNAVKKIADLHPTLGRHLDVSVRTGTFCEYAPEKSVTWLL